MAHLRSSHPAGFEVEVLSRQHGRRSFCCGIEALDDYIKNRAAQDASRNVAVCFVATPDGVTVGGFYTLSQYSVHLTDLPDETARKLPRYPQVPCTLLGRLAVANGFRGRGVGEFLLLDAMHRCWRQSLQVASAALVVDAKDDLAKKFYEHFGFMALPRESRRLFLPTKMIARLFP